ncbi:methyl-accepting chemotaxis protein [Clostridium sp.]|uniref:methyl-accepting chemotaxis protein n=1 Tax=Clostridium sp. TaxID=1506 RepID=UPI003A5C6A35
MLTSKTIATASVKVLNTQEQLNLEISKVSKLANDIESLLSLINDISSNTKLLSLNASIEAARAKEAGRGFSIVAKEIEKLSNKIRKTVEQINTFTKHIKATISSTTSLGKTNLELNEKQMTANKNITINLEETVDIVKNLVDLTNTNN